MDSIFALCQLVYGTRHLSAFSRRLHMHRELLISMDAAVEGIIRKKMMSIGATRPLEATIPSDTWFSLSESSLGCVSTQKPLSSLQLPLCPSLSESLLRHILGTLIPYPSVMDNNPSRPHLLPQMHVHSNQPGSRVKGRVNITTLYTHTYTHTE